MGKFQAVVLDWAGTMVDFGSFAPVDAFRAAFSTFGVEVTDEETRKWMGLSKREHIRAMMQAPRIAECWTTQQKTPPNPAAVDMVYEAFLPFNRMSVAKRVDLVPGAAEAVAGLRLRGLKIGSTTGYPRTAMGPLLSAAASQGYEPDNLVCSDDIPEGRPSPFGMYRCFLDLAVHPPSAVIKVDDTEPGIGEGKAVGCVTVGVALSGNHVGRTPKHLAEMDEDEIDSLRRHAAARLCEAGADHVVDTVAELPALVDRLERI